MIHLKGLLTLAAVAISLTLGTYGIAQAATPAADSAGFAVKASAYQNAAIAQAIQNNPAGVRVAADEVEWDGGKIVMLVPASPDATTNGCPYSITLKWTCVYNRINFRGTQLQFHDAGSDQDLYSFGGKGWHTRSWVNNRWQRAYLYQSRAKHHGATMCMSRVATGSNSNGDPASHDRWIYLAKSGSTC
jgi:hypothetical protein